jgi:hypothetical protein
VTVLGSISCVKSLERMRLARLTIPTTCHCENGHSFYVMLFEQLSNIPQRRGRSGGDDVPVIKSLTLRACDFRYSIASSSLLLRVNISSHRAAMSVPSSARRAKSPSLMIDQLSVLSTTGRADRCLNIGDVSHGRVRTDRDHIRDHDVSAFTSGALLRPRPQSAVTISDAA